MTDNAAPQGLRIGQHVRLTEVRTSMERTNQLQGKVVEIKQIGTDDAGDAWIIVYGGGLTHMLYVAQIAHEPADPATPPG